MDKKSIILCLTSLLCLQNLKPQATIENDSLKKEEWIRAEKSICLLKNQDQIIPVKGLAEKNIAFLSIADDRLLVFRERLADYAQISDIRLKNEETESHFRELKDQLKKYNLVIFAMNSLNKNDGISGGLRNQAGEIVQFLADSVHSIIVVFGHPKAIGELQRIRNGKAIIFSPDKSAFHQDITAQIIFGGIGARGKLPEDINHEFRKDSGLESEGGIRFKFTFPEELGINGTWLNKKVDSIAALGIQQGAFPGCQVLAAKDGKIFFHKTYGFHQFDSIRPVKKTDLYDLASITKITGPLPALMKLTGEGKLKLDAKFADYWPPFKNTDKKDITIREALAHQAGFPAWIPFWKYAFKKNGKYKFHTLKPDSAKNYPIKMTDKLWLHKKYSKTFYKKIKKTKLLDKKEYLYSCLSFHIYPRIIEQLTNENYEAYMDRNFYKPLGANSITYNPLKKFPLERIIPTEMDSFFRKQLIHGTVHDEGAAMLGGISGNAGLFSSTLDLAKIMQMYLNMGNYGGQQFIDEKTFNEYNRCQFPWNNNRRGLGFDKLSKEKKEPGYISNQVSEKSFGHTGFTGTMCWADPETGLIYILMTNRVYPTRNNAIMFGLNIRPSIQQVFIDALVKK